MEASISLVREPDGEPEGFRGIKGRNERRRVKESVGEAWSSSCRRSKVSKATAPGRLRGR